MWVRPQRHLHAGLDRVCRARSRITCDSFADRYHHDRLGRENQSMYNIIVRSIAGLVVTGAASLLLCVPTASASENLLAEFKTSGVIFKDAVQVLRLEDPEVEGVVVYYTDYTRSITEKLTSSEDAFSDPSQSSISCTNGSGGAIVKDPSAIRGAEGKEIFSEAKGLNIFQNKKTRIRRIYDEKNENVLYVAYNTRNTRSKDEGGVSSSRYRTSMCSVHVHLHTQ